MPRTSCPLTSLVLPADHAGSLGAGRYLLDPGSRIWRPHRVGPLRCRGGTERRARTTAINNKGPAQNGTSGVLAEGKHALRGAAWATPRTGVMRQADYVQSSPPSACHVPSDPCTTLSRVSPE